MGTDFKLPIDSSWMQISARKTCIQQQLSIVLAVAGRRRLHSAWPQLLGRRAH